MELLSNHKCVCKNCELKSKNQVFVAKGKATEYRLENYVKKVVDKYIVDDCLLGKFRRDEKCDYLFVVVEIKNAIFIECKGSDVLKAVSQLTSSISLTEKELNGYLLKGRIIPTRVYNPDLRTTAYKKLREKLKGHLETKNKVFIETI